jgi:C1A family cysteine protease
MKTYAMGWVRELPDFRDYSLTAKGVAKVFENKPDLLERILKGAMRKREDLREWCPPIEDQEAVGSCTAHAGVALVEYCEKKAAGVHLDASRLFLYKVTRNLLHWTGDTGAYLRTTMKAMRLFGVPPEEYYGYDVARFDDEPEAFLYAFAANYKALVYTRLDIPGTDKDDLLRQIKRLLRNGFPSMFGFTVYSSLYGAEQGRIPYPGEGDKVVGGHAVVAVGYDNDLEIGEDTGALLIRNSWGTDWGEDGYGWLPYKYVTTGLAVDWWTLFKQEWVDTGQFD